MKIYVFLVLCVLFWSGNFVLGRFIADDIEPLEMVFFRWLFTLVIISPVLIVHFSKIMRLIKENLLIMLVLSSLGISIFNTLVYTALNYTTATNALIINSSVPIIILLLSFVILKQAINMKQVIGILLSTIGVLYLILQGDVLKLFKLEFNVGDLWVVASSLIWALYSVFVRFKPKEFANFDFFSAIVLMGFIMLLPLYFYQGYTLEREITLVKNNYWVFLYVSILPSVLSYYFWNRAITEIGASKTGQFTHLMPIFGAILAYVFLDEVMSYYHIVGAFLIGVGIYMSLLIKEKE